MLLCIGKASATRCSCAQPHIIGGKHIYSHKDLIATSSPPPVKSSTGGGGINYASECPMTSTCCSLLWFYQWGICFYDQFREKCHEKLHATTLSEIDPATGSCIRKVNVPKGANDTHKSSSMLTCNTLSHSPLFP